VRGEPRPEGTRVVDVEGRGGAGGQPAFRGAGRGAWWRGWVRGWPVGVAAAWPWAFVFAVGRLVEGTRRMDEGGWVAAVLPWVLLGAIVGGLLAAGAWFGRAVGLGWRGAAAVAAVHLAATFAGIAGAGRVEVMAIQEGRFGFGLGIWQLPLVFAGAFGQYVGLTLGLTTLAAGLLGRVGRAWRTALAAAALGALGYAAVALLLNLIPEWRIGGGHGAMVKVASAANLIVLTLGASGALAALRRHNRRA
jgi:hypothetical protein